MTATTRELIESDMAELFDRLDQECEEWDTATVLLRKSDGDIAGYGRLDRKARTMTVTSDPSGVSFLS